MFLGSSTQASGDLQKWATELQKSASQRNGQKFNQRLFTPLKRADLVSATPNNLHKMLATGRTEFVTDYILFLRAREIAQNEVGALQSLASFVRKVTSVYAETEEEDGNDGSWLFPVFAHAVVWLRKFATKIDAESTTKWRKTVVEVFREIFPKLLKQKNRLPGTCWLICQLLCLYIELDQVKLCAHLLAALTQSLAKEGGFDPESVPKSVSVTLFYYWGRFHVMESKFTEAKEKLEWAFVHCHEDSSNKARIAEYLIPCMIASGVFPKTDLIRECGMGHLVNLVDAVKSGDVETYNAEIVKRMPTLAKSGTLILLEKCKLICYRNLTKRIAYILAEGSSDACKLDIDAFAAVWHWLEKADKNETLCALADLIYAGAIKGYLAPDHNKLVLSKATPFPPLDQVVG